MQLWVWITWIIKRKHSVLFKSNPFRIPISDKKDMELKHSGKTAKRTVSSGQSNRQVPGKGTATPGQRRKSRWTTGTSAREKDLWGEGGGGVQKGLGLERSWQPNTQSQETGVCVEHLPTVFYVQGTIHILSHLTPIASLYMLLLQFYRLRKKLI